MCPVCKPKLTGFYYVPREGNSLGSEDGGSDSAFCDVMLNGKNVDTLLDTGSSMSLVKRCHVYNSNVNCVLNSNSMCAQ